MGGSSSGVDVVALDTAGLGDRSYLAHDGTTAFVVDPQRDIDRMLSLAGRLGVSITHVFETHVHNDYVTGGLALARVTGAAYHVSAADEVAFDRTGVHEGDVVGVGPAMRVRALVTPGHTFTHVSYALEDEGQAVAVFTGGSLLYGATGRTDLLGAEHARVLARAQYASAHRLAKELPDEAAVYPTHGFGSFCAASQSEGTSSTIGQERRVNPVLTAGEEHYVADLLAGLDAYPAYYAHMAPANAAGPSAPDLTPPHRAEAAEVRQRIEAGEWVVDLRDRTAFAAGHVRGTLSFALADGIATYLGWLIPWGTPLTLLGETARDVADAQRELARIGIERPAAAATGQPREWGGDQLVRSYPVRGFADLAAASHPAAADGQAAGKRGTAAHRLVVLDVRLTREYDESHVDGALHIPLHELQARVDEVPDGEVWVHCASGHRSAIAAAILDAVGRTVIAVDDSFDHAGAAGLPLSGSAR